MLPSTSSATLSTHSISSSPSSSHENTATVSTSGLVKNALSSITPDHACIEKQVHLNQSTDDIDKSASSSYSKNTGTGERIGQKIDQVVPKIKRETERVGKQFENEFKRTGAKIKGFFK